MRKNKIFSLIIVCILTLSLRAGADDLPIVKARFSPDTVLIGDQPELIVTVRKDVAQKLFFPEFDKKIYENIEHISTSEVDTVTTDGSRVVELTKKYKVTIFDAGNYILAPLPLLMVQGEKVDTIFTDSLKISVLTYQIDPQKQTINNIAMPIAAPLLFSEIALYLLIGILIVALVAFIIYAIIRYRDKKSLFTRKKLPPHIIATNELEKVREMQLWQNGKFKEYYTEIADIVREYIEGRFGRNAKEMTTEEIMVAVKDDAISELDRNMLFDLLSLADLVKFAKYIPDAESNEKSFELAYEFVEHTKSDEKVIDEVVEQPEAESAAADGVAVAETADKPNAESTTVDSDNRNYDRKEEER